MNQKHRDMEKLTASSPRAKTGLVERSERACDEGRRTAAFAKDRRGSAVHREHEIASKESRRLRKRETRLGKVLTGTKMRRSDGLLSEQISATFYGSAAAAARPRVGAVGFGGAVALFKAPSACGASQPRGSRAAVAQTRADSGSVTRWKKALTGGPYLSATQGAGPACQWKK